MPDPPIRERLAFVICTEPGTLERKSVMLVKTLRAFGGRLSDCAVLSYSPRDGRVPHRRTLEFFERAGVEAVIEPLNRELEHYGFGNKVVACAHAEATRSYERLVFLDSDMFVLREPVHLWSDRPDGIKACPVERKLAGSTGSDEHAPYWRILFDRAGVDDPCRVETTVTGERVWGYWNAGVVSVPGGGTLLRRWSDTLHGLLRDDLVHPLGMDFMDQIALALVLHGSERLPEELPLAYNFPVSSFLQAPSPAESLLEDVVIAHYHKIFDDFPFRNPLGGRLPSDRRSALAQIIDESGLVGPVGWVKHRLALRMKALFSPEGR